MARSSLLLRARKVWDARTTVASTWKKTCSTIICQCNKNNLQEHSIYHNGCRYPVTHIYWINAFNINITCIHIRIHIQDQHQHSTEHSKQHNHLPVGAATAILEWPWIDGIHGPPHTATVGEWWDGEADVLLRVVKRVRVVKGEGEGGEGWGWWSEGDGGDGDAYMVKGKGGSWGR